MADLLKVLPVEKSPRLLVGRETSDDAGVFLLDSTTALVQTVDFLTPMVNDPYDFGCIAAANALSDVYAMGGKPLTAMNIVCFPTKKLEISYLSDILKGGLDKIHEAGAVLVGGHSVEDDEIKYGLAVTGVVNPERILTNSSAQEGDRLILTKPLGTGILSTALKGRIISEDDILEAVVWMATLNKGAAEVMEGYPVHACTDVTGFGLLGHTLEMAVASGVVVLIEGSKLPVLNRVQELASMGIIPAGGYVNRTFCSKKVFFDPVLESFVVDIISDPQTSGGLLMSVSPDKADLLVEELRSKGFIHASVIGRVLKKGEPQVQVVP